MVLGCSCKNCYSVGCAVREAKLLSILTRIGPFTINELKRIQALPDDFVLTGSFDQKAERIGRMVPPLLTSAIASQINERIFKQLKGSLKSLT
jgi:site-specific DNA-cytosine methylase